MRRPRLQRLDPGLYSLKSAARAAIVMPLVFAFADKVINDRQTATFAAFGSFAILVLADFSGVRRARLQAYLGLAGSGAILIVLGTLCSRNPWIAAVAMAVVGFGVLFSAVISGYFAAAGTAAMLTFVLPVTVPANPSTIPARLEGWGLAASVGICAAMLLWPTQPRDKLRTGIARACRALAELVQCELEADLSLVARADAARDAIAELRQEFLAAPYRPTGSTSTAAAAAFMVDELDWFKSFVLPPGDSEPRIDVCGEENRAVLAAVVAALRQSAARLDGGGGRPDLERLDATRDAVAEAVAQRIAEQPFGDELELAAALEQPFRVRALSYSARQIASSALRATGGRPTPDTEEAPETPWYRPAVIQSSAVHVTAAVHATERLAAQHASPRSVLFQNSVRGAAALAISVFIAQKTGLQHGFWVVLGTLSVLRSNALATGATVLRALAGTAIGIVIGASLIVAIGNDEGVVWAVLPVAVLLAAYAPRVISFSAGQAGFTVVVLILFNLIQPSGWKVGIVRVEDVAIGFAVSIGVGLLFWPRGGAALMRHSLARTYASAAEYVVAAVQRLEAGDGPALTEQAARGVTAESLRLDDALRQYLGERSPKRMNMDSVATLVAGARRVQRTAVSVVALCRFAGGFALGEGCARSLDREVMALQSWYTSLGNGLVAANAPPPQHEPDSTGRKRVLECARMAVAGGDGSSVRAGLSLLWASQHLDNLWRLEAHLAPPAAEASQHLGPARVSARARLTRMRRR